MVSLPTALHCWLICKCVDLLLDVSSGILGLHRDYNLGQHVPSRNASCTNNSAYFNFINYIIILNIQLVTRPKVKLKVHQEAVIETDIDRIGKVVSTSSDQDDELQISSRKSKACSAEFSAQK